MRAPDASPRESYTASRQTHPNGARFDVQAVARMLGAQPLAPARPLRRRIDFSDREAHEASRQNAALGLLHRMLHQDVQTQPLSRPLSGRREIPVTQVSQEEVDAWENAPSEPAQPVAEGAQPVSPNLIGR